MKKWLAIFLFSLTAVSAEESFVSLGPAGGIRYIHDGQFLFRVERISPNDEVMYTHSYSYDEEGYLASETLIGNLGKIEYTNRSNMHSPYHYEERVYDDRHKVVKQVIDGICYEHSYNDAGALQKP